MTDEEAIVALRFILFIISLGFFVLYFINRIKSKKEIEQFIKEHTK